MKTQFFNFSLLILLSNSIFAATEPVPCKITRGCKDCMYDFYIKTIDGKTPTLPKITRKDDPLYIHSQLAADSEKYIIQTFNILVERNICLGSPLIPAPKYNTGATRECYLQECLSTRCMFDWYIKTRDGALEDVSASLSRITSQAAMSLSQAEENIKLLQKFGFCKAGAYDIIYDTVTP